MHNPIRSFNFLGNFIDIKVVKIYFLKKPLTYFDSKYTPENKRKTKEKNLEDKNYMLK